MKVRDVIGINDLKFAVVNAQYVVVSLHRNPDSAETARKSYRYGDDFTTIELDDVEGLDDILLHT